MFCTCGRPFCSGWHMYHQWEPAPHYPAPVAPTQHGWTCPKCGGVNAPWMPCCAHCRPDVDPRAPTLGTGDKP